MELQLPPHVYNTAHIFAIAPLMIYVGISKSKTPDAIFNLLVALGVAMVLFYAYKYKMEMEMKVKA